MAVIINGPDVPGQDQILTEDTLSFLSELHAQFEERRRMVLKRRQSIQDDLLKGRRPDFRKDTEAIRQGDWEVGNIPDDLLDRRVEITGPTDAKMIINALNSGAKVFMADFEDANSPWWQNMIQGQINLTRAIARTLTYTSPKGDHYQLKDHLATLIVRPRGWHLDEAHVLVDGERMSASLFDFGVYVFHNGHHLVEQGSGPYFYLPKLENMEEAQLWNDVFDWTEKRLRLAPGTIKATVLIETILAAFEMEEILWALKDHIVGLNAGRWDYLFSIIKKFRHTGDVLAADRQSITMTVPFMRAYTELLVRTCHRRGAYAIGGMAAFIPSRRHPEINQVALAKVREDKEREARDGYDGTWVAHPDLVPVAMDVFNQALGEGKSQRHRLRDDVHVSAEDLLDFRVPGGQRTEEGLVNNVAVGIQYLASWFAGNGAVGLYNLMEDAATAEISRAQVWQWVLHGASLDHHSPLTHEAVDRVIQQGVQQWGEQWEYLPQAVELFREVALSPQWVDFLTLPAYEKLLKTGR
ncbi:malate synthase A [Sulfobacillus thermosulfidooxidans]|uniref:malate synthase A n=1 Tax=Sulfobacillus thermosulfidooxidans TaxID=28034 RepID=UPI00178D0486|nr:malate synthase A [Sulfobacillus thermosulfidooxidans]